MAAMPEGVTKGEDGISRCRWGNSAPEYGAYHDTEWGFPVDDDIRLFEKLSLEGFQSGLSWLTILRKREGFRKAFKGFDPNKVARFSETDVERLLGDASIIRHRGKIEAVINNAQRMTELRDSEGSLAAYVWQFEPKRHKSRRNFAEVPAVTPESQAMAKDLKKRGWRFVGPTTAYAFMQAMGLVNDHMKGCVAQPKAQDARAVFTVPRADRARARP
jgi:DNA-3-methyladenine glycosylase I